MNVSLVYKGGNSHKVYQVNLVNVEDGCLVNYAHGRYGSTLRTGTKTQSPVDNEKAIKIFNQLVSSKVKKGYKDENGSSELTNHVESNDTGIRCQLLNAIGEQEALSLITSKSSDWWMQEKMDGERKLLKVVKNKALVINKLGNSTSIAQEIIDEVLAISDDVLLDGEAVGGVYWVFDILEFKGKDLRNMPYNERMFILQCIGFNGCVRVVETARTIDEKRMMNKELIESNAEGRVFKDPSAVFSEGRPNSGGSQVKSKFYETASVLVSRINKQRSVGMQLLDSDGKMVDVGNLSIPVNADFPAVGDICEVRYLYAYPHGSLYQPTYLFSRDDVQVNECVASQLKYKRE